MNWQDIRSHYPNQWILFEAIQAHSDQTERILDQVAVICTYPDSKSAMMGYQQLHRDAPGRELYIFHASREELNIHERFWTGVRYQ